MPSILSYAALRILGKGANNIDGGFGSFILLNCKDVFAVLMGETWAIILILMLTWNRYGILLVPSSIGYISSFSKLLLICDQNQNERF